MRRYNARRLQVAAEEVAADAAAAAAADGDAELVATLLKGYFHHDAASVDEANQKLDGKHNLGSSELAVGALVAAVEHARPSIVDLLLSHNVEVKLGRKRDGQTPLVAAAALPHTFGLLTKLLEANADPTQAAVEMVQTRSGNAWRLETTPLFEAARAGSCEAVTTLLDCSASPNVQRCATTDLLYTANVFPPPTSHARAASATAAATASMRSHAWLWQSLCCVCILESGCLHVVMLFASCFVLRSFVRT